jgi:hypothetical protein
MAVLEAELETDCSSLLGVFIDMSYTPGPSNLALLPIRADFRVLERLANVSYMSHTATHSHTATDIVSAAIDYS